MTEAELQQRIRTMCANLGLAVDHVENSLKGRTWLPGMPDLTIFGKTILYAELKAEHEDLDPAQVRAKYVIQSAGGQWRMWKPSNLHSGEIGAELTAMAFDRRKP